MLLRSFVIALNCCCAHLLLRSIAELDAVNAVMGKGGLRAAVEAVNAVRGGY